MIKTGLTAVVAISIVLGFVLFGLPGVFADHLNPVASPTTQASSVARELLKKQAEDRKVFYDELAAARRTLKYRQKTELDELLKKHRAERDEFSKQTGNDADHRKAFFSVQREQMATLKSKHSQERKEQAVVLKKKRDDFHEKQRLDRKAVAPN